ncbi:MAG: hypothetical protein ACRDCF_02335 [Mycoplasmoidaceae bacterium]
MPTLKSTSLSTSINGALSSEEMVYIFLGFLVIVVSIMFIKKLIYRYKYKKRYYILPRTNIKGISYIAMVVALSVAIIILLTIITYNSLAVLFRSFPGTRITLEGILIKIGGLLFGPFIGMFIGGATDMLTIALTAGVFHYGYFIAALTYGLLGGFIRTLVVFSKRREWKFALYSSISLILSCVGICLFLLGTAANWDLNTPLSISFLGKDLNFKMLHIILMIAIMNSLGIIAIMLFYFVSHKSNKKWIRNQFMTFCPVISLVFISEVVVNLFMLPVFDADISTLGYAHWITIRGFLFIPLVLGNIIVIWPIYKIIYPLVGYKYEQDVVEDIHIPLINYKEKTWA